MCLFSCVIQVVKPRVVEQLCGGFQADASFCLQVDFFGVLYDKPKASVSIAAHEIGHDAVRL